MLRVSRLIYTSVPCRSCCRGSFTAMANLSTSEAREAREAATGFVLVVVVIHVAFVVSVVQEQEVIHVVAEVVGGGARHVLVGVQPALVANVDGLEQEARRFEVQSKFLLLLPF